MTEMIQTSAILVKDAKLVAVTLNESYAILEMIEETRQRQEEILKLKSVDQDSLRMVVQL